METLQINVLLHRPNVKREHWGFDDPAKAEGTDEEKWAFFERVRDEIGERIKRFAETGE